MVIHGTADHLVPFLQSERFVDAMEKAGAPFYFHTVVGAGHNPYFGLNFNASGSNFEGSGGGIGIFEDRMVEPLIFAFFRHYLIEGSKDLFLGVGVSDSAGKTMDSPTKIGPAVAFESAKGLRPKKRAFRLMITGPDGAKAR
jgi:acetyl esterase/lipase